MAHSAAKRSKLSATAAAAAASCGQYGEGEEEQPLLPGLPDHLAQLCLSLVPPALLYSVCRLWRRIIYSPFFPPFLSLYAVLYSPDSPNGGGSGSGGGDESIGFYSFDPIAAVWAPLPAPPPNPPLRLLLRHPSFIARELPVQSVSASGNLVLLAATAHRLLPAFHRPLVFHPASLRWRLGPPIPTPRRWCVAGAADGCVYLASGVGLEYSAEVARSVERWDPRQTGSGWDRLAPLRDSRFSREAVDAVAYRGKLCMVNVKGGRGPKEGAVYDIASDRWEEMPPGLLSGWTGPAAAEPNGGPIYSVDEATGALRAYDWKRDRWRVVVESERLKGAVQVAAGGGRVFVACCGVAVVVVVDVGAKPGRLWVVDPPPGKRVLALHVLPRMSRAES